MGYEFGRATTAAEIEAVQRLRYSVYVEEMKRYDDVDGAEDGRFAESEDEHSWICYARDGVQVVAATRMTWGGDGFSDRQVDQFQLAPFLAELPADVLGVGERNTVLPSHRGSGVLDQLLDQERTILHQAKHQAFLRTRNCTNTLAESGPLAGGGILAYGFAHDV